VQQGCEQRGHIWGSGGCGRADGQPDGWTDRAGSVGMGGVGFGVCRDAGGAGFGMGGLRIGSPNSELSSAPP